MARWFVKPADDARVGAIAQATGLPGAIARSLFLRGYDSVETVRAFLASRETLRYLDDPILTPGMERAVARIRRAIDSQEPMVIYGDYDCDGVTSTSLLYRYLKNGLRDGYGVTPHAVERLAKQGVRLIVTCDNGIAAHAAARTAQEAGIDLIVTDHHQVPETLPECHAIVHPGVEFPHLKDMAGVGVAYLLALALEGRRTERMGFLEDFVTIGTVADMVPLDGPNRPLVWSGLERFRSGAKRFPGLQALAKVAGTSWETFGATDIGFEFGPRINAAGRLEEPDVGFKLFTAQTEREAMAYASELDRLNKERRTLNKELEAEILDRIERTWDLEAEPFVVLADPAYHHGITGIVAGRVKERYRVPVLLLSEHGDGIWKGSGRSPEGVHLYEALHAARSHLIGFGGHAQAAGCSARAEDLPALRRALNGYLAEIGWKRSEDLVALDAEVPFEEVTLGLLDELDRLEPFGQKNPAPVFGLMRARVVGQEAKGDHLFLKLDDGVSVRRVPAWNRAADAEALSGWVRLTYRMKRSTYRPGTVDLTAGRIEAADAPPPVDLDRLLPPDDPPARRDEDPLTIEELRGLYQALLEERRGRSADLPIELPGFGPDRLSEALDIFREAGLCLVQGDSWRLLRAPDATISLGAIAAYRRHLTRVRLRPEGMESSPT